MPGVKPSKDQLLAVLSLAAQSPHGLLLRSNDPVRLRMALYNSRAKARDARFDNLQFRVSPFPDGDLVVCRGAGASSRARGLPGPEAQADLADLISDPNSFPDIDI